MSDAPECCCMMSRGRHKRGDNIKMGRSDRIMGVRVCRVGVSVVELSVSSTRGMA